MLHEVGLCRAAAAPSRKLPLGMMDFFTHTSSVCVHVPSCGLDQLEATREGRIGEYFKIFTHPHFNGINKKDASGRTALDYCAKLGLADVPLAILTRPNFTKGSAEARINGST